EHNKGQLREGLAYVRRTPHLFGPLLLMAIVGALAYEFRVSLPLVAKFTFHGGASQYGAMTSAMGIGAVVGGLFTAGRSAPTSRSLVYTSLAFGACITAATLAPNFTIELVAMLFVGAGSIVFLSVANTTLQL